jgi:type VI secretion system secreted protein VgrG
MTEPRALSVVELTVGDGDPRSVDLEMLRFRHAIAELYEIDLVVVVQEDVELEESVGENVRVTLSGMPEWSLGQLEGILWQIHLLSLGETGIARYALRIAPPARLLAERDDHRIFRNLTVPEVVAAVLGGYAAFPQPAAQLVEDHPSREFTVQYNECDLALLERLTADEGITMLHDPRDGGRPILVDDTSRLDRSSALALRCSYQSEGRELDEVPHIRDVELGREIRTARVTVGDYDFTKPRHALAAGADASAAPKRGEDALEHYAFEVGRFAADTDGKTRAKRLLEGRRVGSRVLSGRVDFPIAAGHLVRIDGHRRASVDGDYLVIESRFMVDRQGERIATIRAIPAATSYRARCRPKPRIAGTQTATVVGAPGETVDVDDQGRVEVAFHWDRRRIDGPGASRRVRVTQSWGGSGHGMFTVPRVGDEVVVAFADGDPDEPLIVGQVHNGVRPAPLSLPDSKTQAVWRSQSIGAGGKVGFNHVLMEDAAGRERLELRSERDFVAQTLNDEKVTVGSSSTKSVGGSESLTVGGTREVTIGADEQILVKEMAELRAKNTSLVAEEEIVLMSDGMSMIANVRTDETDERHTIDNKELVVRSSDIASVASKRVQIFAHEVFEVFIGAYMVRADAEGIVLNGPGSTFTLSAEGITMATAGIVDIKGTLVKINS